MISMEEWQLGWQKSGDVTRRFTLGFCFVEGDWGPKLMDPNDHGGYHTFLKYLQGL